MMFQDLFLLIMIFDFQELCSHHGVILKSYKIYDCLGILSLVQYVSKEIILESSETFMPVAPISSLFKCLNMFVLFQGSVKYIEWKAAEVNVDSDTQDQEWAVVSTGRSSRHRSNSGRHFPLFYLLDLNSVKKSGTNNIHTFSFPLSECARAEPLRLNTVNLKSFRVSRHRHGPHLTFASREESRSIVTFIFHHGNADYFVKCLLGHLKAYR